MKVSLNNIENKNFEKYCNSFIVPIYLHYFQSAYEIQLESLQPNDEILLTNSMIGIIRSELKNIPLYCNKEIVIRSIEGNKFKMKCILSEIPTKNFYLPESLPKYLIKLYRKYQIVSENSKIVIIPNQNPITPSLSNNNIFCRGVYEIMDNIFKYFNNHNNGLSKCILIKDYPGNCTSNQLSRYLIENRIKLVYLSPFIIENIYKNDIECCLNNYFNRVMEIGRCVLVFDKLECLGDEKSILPLIELINRFNNSPIKNIKLISIITLNYKSESNYENLFGERITIPLLSEENRIEMYESLKDINYSPHFEFEEDVDLIEIAKQSYSYTAADIICLVKKAYLESYPSSKISMKVLMNCLNNNYTPIPLVNGGIKWKIEIPKINWESIKGLEEAKNKLIEMIILPQKYKNVYILIKIYFIVIFNVSTKRYFILW